MPIRPLLEGAGAFGPKQIEVIVEAFEGVLNDLRLHDRKDPVVMMMANLTIELATQGELTAAQLRTRVMREMRREAGE